ncbi:MAG TPA: hypothetical protein VGK22_24125 [Candidatus Angelobacter sp.]|jgi:hypothetical protein
MGHTAFALEGGSAKQGWIAIKKEANNISPAVKTYLDIASSFIEGLYRLWGAEAASSRLMCALIQFHASGRKGLDGPLSEILDHLDRVPYSSYDALAYVTNVSHLVYATTLLDSFLTDTSLFLFLLNPQSMGKNSQVSLRTLIQSASRNEALTQAALNKAREISYLPFPARIQFFTDTFGLRIELTPDAVEALTHYPSIRNTAVHDQGIYEIRLEEDGHVTSRQKTCAKHPTHVSPDDVFKAIKAYEKVVGAVAQAVFFQVLKETGHPAVKHFIEGSGYKSSEAAAEGLREESV